MCSSLVLVAHLKDNTADCGSCFSSSRDAATHFASFNFQNCISEKKNITGVVNQTQPNTTAQLHKHNCVHMSSIERFLLSTEAALHHSQKFKTFFTYIANK